MKIADFTFGMPYIIWVTSITFKFILKLEARLNSEFCKNRSNVVMLIPTVSLRTHCSSCLSSGNIKADHLVINLMKSSYNFSYVLHTKVFANKEECWVDLHC